MGTFYISLLIASAVFSIGSFLFGHDGGHEVGHAGGGGDGIPSVFSLRVISLFVLGFSGLSTIAHFVWRLTPASSSLCGLGGGVVLGGFAYALIYTLCTQQASSLVAPEAYVNLPARVSVAIPAKSTGEISVTVKGELRSVLAVSADGTALSAGRAVVIVSIAAGTATVMPS
jgi:hypothetical protein